MLPERVYNVIVKFLYAEECSMKNLKKTVKEYALLIIGSFILSVGVYFFKIPNGFATGGVSGIGTILGKLTDAISPSTWIMLINALLLVVGFIFLGKETGVKTVISSLLYSGLAVVFERLYPMASPFTGEPFMELFYAMILTSLGAAMIFHSGGSSGGTDIVALILKKYTMLNVGKALLAVDFIIAASSFFVFGISAGLFSMLGLFSKAFLVDMIIDNVNSCKYFVAITDKVEPVTEFVLKELHHGATVTEAQGVYTHTKKYMVHTVCKRIEAIRLRKHIKEIDPHAFIIITTSSEIIGRGFRSV